MRLILSKVMRLAFDIFHFPSPRETMGEPSHIRCRCALLLNIYISAMKAKDLVGLGPAWKKGSSDPNTCMLSSYELSALQMR